MIYPGLGGYVNQPFLISQEWNCNSQDWSWSTGNSKWSNKENFGVQPVSQGFYQQQKHRSSQQCYKHMVIDQRLLCQVLGEWTSIYQLLLLECEQKVYRVNFPIPSHTNILSEKGWIQEGSIEGLFNKLQKLSGKHGCWASTSGMEQQNKKQSTDQKTGWQPHCRNLQNRSYSPHRFPL